MRDFTDALDAHLRELASASPGPEPSPPWSGRRVVAATGALAAALAGLAIAIFGATASHADLPILSGPERDIHVLRSHLPALADAGMDFERARHFQTRGGTAFALTDSDARTLCVALPDPELPDSFGTACDSLQAVERSGLAVQIVGNQAANPAAVTVFAFVLPESATDVRLQIGSRRTAPTITRGVAVGTARQTAVLSWRSNGRTKRHRFSAPSRASNMMLDCGDGRVVTLDGAGLNSEQLTRERRRRC